MRHLPVTSPTMFPRRGAVLAIALVSLTLVAGIIGHQVVRVTREMRQQRMQLAELQARKLVEAVFRSSVDRLQQEPEWTGGQWSIPQGVVSRDSAAEIRISIQQGRITVQAHLPTAAGNGCRITRSGS